MRRFVAGILMPGLAGVASGAGDCLVLRDSIADGISSRLANDRTLQCETIAKLAARPLRSTHLCRSMRRPAIPLQA